jgi:poly(A) polymerase
MVSSANGASAAWLRDIDPDAIRVVKKLQAAGFEAYLVGGCVRDLLLKRRPKDFDVATSATPEELRRLFRNSRIIGRRFTIVHVFFGQKIIETTTFRREPQGLDAADGPLEHDNSWGTIGDDARRRDFTVNALFLDVETLKVVDLEQGLPDLERGLIRTIGEPSVRFREDPVRMVRAIKFAARLDFTIEESAWRAVREVGPDIAQCSKARVLEEVYKLLRSGAAHRSFSLMLEAGLFHHTWPGYTKLFEASGGLQRNPDSTQTRHPSAVLWRGLEALDSFIDETGQIPDNAVLVALLFLPLVPVATFEMPTQRFIEELDALMKGPSIALGMARRDREVAQDLLDAYRRINVQGRNAMRGQALMRRHFHDAMIFLSFVVVALGGKSTELAVWQGMGGKRLPSAKAPEPESNDRENDRNLDRRRKRRRHRFKGGR